MLKSLTVGTVKQCDYNGGTMIQTSIFINTQIEFIHQYKGAPEEVSYLRYPHRHLAHIKVEIEVFHNEREVEFIMLKHQVDDFLQKRKMNELTNDSCETVARDIWEFICSEYGSNRTVDITVSEDGENGCVLRYRKEKCDDKNLERT